MSDHSLGQRPGRPAARVRAPFALGAWPAVALAALHAERERWALWLPVALGIGVGAYFALPVEPAPWIGPVWLGLALLLIAVARGREGMSVALAIFVAFMALGFIAADLRTELAAAPVLAKKTAAISITGRVVAVEPQVVGTRLVLDRLDAPSIDGPVPRRARITVRAKDVPPAPGDRVRLRAVLMPPPEPTAPGAYDFARTLYFRGIGAVGYAVSRAERLGGADQARPWIATLRHGITERILAGLDGTPGAVAAALLTGERGRIPEPVMESMRKSGLAHLLAISGLHMGLVAATLFFVFRLGMAAIEPVALRHPIKKWAAMVALAGALFYLLISGATVPTQRAFVMVGLVLVAVLIDRTAISMRLVAWAALGILLLRPESLLSASFQLSFAAVVALIATWEAARGRWSTWRGSQSVVRQIGLYLLGVAFTSVIATAATAPFAAYHFDRVAVYGLLANLLAVPVTALWIMPFGLLALALMPLGLEHLALAPMGWGLQTIIAVAGTISEWPGAVALVPAAPLGALIAVAAGGLWLCLWRGRWRWAGLAVIAGGLFAFSLARPPDILVDETGKLFAVRGAEGLALSSERLERFSGEHWLRRAGQAASAPWPPDGMRCDRLGCIYGHGAHTVALVRDPRALDEDCGTAEVVISAVPVRWRCRMPATVIDRFDLWRDGAHAIWFDDDGVRVRSVNRRRGARPWVAARGGGARP